LPTGATHVDTSRPIGSFVPAAYHGSWEQPDVKFAEMLLASVAKGDAPNFDLPNDINVELLDIASEAPPPSNDSPVGSGFEPDERKRGWSSALFSSNPHQPASQPNDAPSDRSAVEETQSSRASNASPSTAKSAVDGLFVSKSPDRRPQ
jgi:hypothetical protein